MIGGPLPRGIVVDEMLDEKPARLERYAPIDQQTWAALQRRLQYETDLEWLVVLRGMEDEVEDRMRHQRRRFQRRYAALTQSPDKPYTWRIKKKA